MQGQQLSRHGRPSPLFDSVTDGVVVTAPRAPRVPRVVSVGAVEGQCRGDLQVAGAQDGHQPPAPARQADPRIVARGAGQLSGEPVWPTLIPDLGPEVWAGGLGAAGGERDCGGGDQERAPGL